VIRTLTHSKLPSSSLKSGCLSSLCRVLLWLVLLLVGHIEILLLHQVGARSPRKPFPRMSFALAFSSTSRVPMSPSIVNSYLLYSSEVAKSLQESGNLEIIPPATNLLGNTHGDSLLQFLRSFASVRIS
jgi:hypothetical protein